MTILPRLVAAWSGAFLLLLGAPPGALCGSQPSGSPLRLLEVSGGLFAPQPTLVRTAKFVSRSVYGLMVGELAPQDKTGAYSRPNDAFRFSGDFAPRAADAGTGPAMQLYSGNPCPWCHRLGLVLAARQVPESVVRMVSMEDNPIKASRGGWAFADGRPDPLFGAKDLREVYDKLEPGYVGRCTAPLAVEIASKKPISNESNDLMKVLNALDVGAHTDAEGAVWDVELRPKELQADIDSWATTLYSGLNNGVYRCGFSTAQDAYDAAADAVATTLDKVEAELGQSRFLCGDKISEADLRLFPTIIRYDGAYSTIFKCGFRRVSSLPNTQAWMRDLYQNFAKDTIDIPDAISSYYKWLIPLNPSEIVPRRPDLGLDVPHGRGANTDLFHMRRSTVPQPQQEATARVGEA